MCSILSAQPLPEQYTFEQDEAEYPTIPEVHPQIHKAWSPLQDQDFFLTSDPDTNHRIHAYVAQVEEPRATSLGPSSRASNTITLTL
jgi:hypothetical protein